MEPVNNDYETTTLADFGFIKGGGLDYLIDRRPNIEKLKQIYYEYAQDPSFIAITLTLQPRYSLLTELEIRKIVMNALSACEVQHYIFFPDMDSKYHFHGILKHPLHLRHKLKRFFTITIGYIKIEYLSDIDGWYNYMRKDKGFKSREHPIPLIEPIYSDRLVELYSFTK